MINDGYYDVMQRVNVLADYRVQGLRGNRKRKCKKRRKLSLPLV